MSTSGGEGTNQTTGQERVGKVYKDEDEDEARIVPSVTVRVESGEDSRGASETREAVRP